MVLLLIPALAGAQQDILLSGIAVEQNSRHHSGVVQPLSNVSVDAPGAGPTVTDGRGLFILEFTDLPAGSTATIRARKAGFVIVNGKELQHAAVLGRLLPLRIVMSRPEVLTQNQLAYYGIAQDFLREQREELLAVIRREDEAGQQLVAELEERLGRKFRSREEAVAALSESFDQMARQLSAIAERFATVNLDDQDSLYTRAFQAFSEQVPREALQTLDTVDLETRLLAIESDIQRLEQQKKKEITTLLLRAELHFMAFDWEQADTDLRLALQFDSTDAEVLFDYGNLLAAQGRRTEAAGYYERALLAADSSRLYPLIRNNLANQYYQLGRYQRCEQLYREALGWHQQAQVDTSARIAVLRSSAIQNLANFYVNRRQFAAADTLFHQALDIRRSLEKEDPRRYGFLLANTLHNLGDLYWQWGQRPEAGNYFEEAVTLRRQTPSASAAFAPIFDEQQVGLARALSGLGLLRMEAHDYFLADSLLREALALRQALTTENGNRYDDQLAESYTNLGVLAQRRGDFPTADSLYRHGRQSYESILSTKDRRYRSEWCRLLLNQASLQRAQGDYILAGTTIGEGLTWLDSLEAGDPAFGLIKLQFLREKGAILAAQGRYEEARQTLTAALDYYGRLAVVQRPDDLEIFLLKDLAIVAQNQKNRQAAEGYYRRVLALAEAGQTPLPPFFARLDLANLYLDELKETFSRRRYRQGLRLLEEAAAGLPEQNGSNLGEERDLLRYYFREYEEVRKRR